MAAIALITGVILHQYLAATLIVLMLASGQTLEYYAMRKASFVLRSLVARMPSIAHRKINSHIEDIPLLDIKIDDLIVIYPHETCPIDGIVIDGHGSMDESYLTGEPYQISKTPGTFVLSGAINGETLLVIKTTKLTSDSRYSAIVKVLEEAEQKRPSIRRLGDQIGAIFCTYSSYFCNGCLVCHRGCNTFSFCTSDCNTMPAINRYSYYYYQCYFKSCKTGYRYQRSNCS